jgi:hypothetical protein
MTCYRSRLWEAIGTPAQQVSAIAASLRQVKYAIARAKWMTEHGYLQLLQGGVPH